LADGFKIPERGVDGVVFGRFAGVGEAVGQHALVHELGVGAQDAGGDFGRPVASVRPGSAIIVSRPQSPNQG
jgi:hypothetical protein